MSASKQELLAGLPEAIIQNYSVLSSAALLLYEYLLTFPLEYQYIWHGKTNIMKIFFVLNRYFSLITLYGLVLLHFVEPATNAECRAFYYMYEIPSIITIFAIIMIFVLRTYVIYGKSRVILLLFVPAFGLVGSDIWNEVVTTADALPLALQIGPWNCALRGPSSTKVGIAAQLVDTVSLSFFDASVVILTVYRTGRLALQSRGTMTRGSLSFILFRDGVLYYSAIFGPQFVAIVLNVIILRTDSAALSNVFKSFSNFINVILIIMVNRLVLNLAQGANVREDSEFISPTDFEVPTFASGPFLGNIGGSVRIFSDDADVENLEGDVETGSDILEGNTARSLNVNDAGDFSGNGFNSGSEIEMVHV